jgi:hypothetical protein
MNPLRKATELAFGRMVPVDLVYEVSGREVYRETRTVAQMKRDGLDGESILTWMRDAGMEATGPLRQSDEGPGRCTVSFPVRYDGRPGLLSVTIQARLPWGP